MARGAPSARPGRVRLPVIKACEVGVQGSWLAGIRAQRAAIGKRLERIRSRRRVIRARNERLCASIEKLTAQIEEGEAQMQALEDEARGLGGCQCSRCRAF